MKINWFSPVPPTPSAVASHNAIVLPALAKYAAITVWVHEAKWSADLEQYAAIRRYDPDNVPWAEINAADVTIYHLGNEPEVHGPIWQVNRQHPGIVVLHDLAVQHLFAGLVFPERGLTPEEYRRMMAFYYPDGGARLAEAYLNGEYGIDKLCQDCPLTFAALENATGVAVHTQDGRSLIADATTLPVAYVPLCAAPDESASGDDEPSSPDERPSKEPFRLIMFGFIAVNRRLKSVLRALRDFPQKDRFRLDVYGLVRDEDSIRETIVDYGLEEIVRLRGFVSESELKTALARSDLALNLRDPTMGEASASQLQIWQYGLPSLVTDIGWYSTLPKDTVAMVRRESELSDIQVHLERFLREPEKYRELGRNGRRYVQEHHTVDACVRALLELVEISLRESPARAVSWISHRAGRTIRPWFSESAAGVLLPALAETISRVFDQPSANGR